MPLRTPLPAEHTESFIVSSIGVRRDCFIVRDATRQALGYF
jgi:hypothetical protein